MNKRRRHKAKRRRLERWHEQRMRSWLGDHYEWPGWMLIWCATVWLAKVRLGEVL